MKIGSRKAAAVLAAGLALTAVAACGSNSPSSTPTGGSSGHPVSGGSGVKTASTGLGTVLVDASGRTLYYFKIDTSTTSACSGACAAAWPPVKGPVSAASGTSLPGTFSTITRSDGTVQASYDGHPLYTFSGDSGAGQTNGNGVNAYGGLWYAITPAGSKPGPAPSSSSSSGGGYGGY